jgi:hypothetical protein
LVRCSGSWEEIQFVGDWFCGGGLRPSAEALGLIILSIKLISGGLTGVESQEPGCLRVGRFERDNGGDMKSGNRFGRVVLGLVLCVTVTLAGCSTTWIGEAEQVVAALIPAAANIIALVAALEGKSVSAADLQTIQNAGTQAGSGSAAD